MKIAFVYDNQDDYSIRDKIEYADFCLTDEAELICNSLKKLGHEVVVFKGKNDLKNNLDILLGVDLVFNKTEGFQSRNREGIIPAIMEFYEIPYIGTDAYGFSLSLNKYHTKLIANDKGILTPNFVVLESQSDMIKLESLTFPVIIKPNNEGSSMGCQVFYSFTNEICEAIITLIDKFDQPVIVEEYVSGIDISVPIIGTGEKAKVIGIVEFSNLDGSYPEIASTSFKYIDDYTTKPLIRDDNIIKQITKQSLCIYNSLGCKDYGRIDFRLTKENQAFFLEINPLPTLCSNGAFSICAQKSNQTMVDIINKIILSAIE